MINHRNSGAILTTVVNVAHVCEGYQATDARQIAGIYDAAKAFNGGSFLNNFYDDKVRKRGLEVSWCLS